MARAKARTLRDLKPISGADLPAGLAEALDTPKPKRKARVRAPRTLREASQQKTLREQVASERRKVKRTPETGDVLQGTRKPKRAADGLKHELEGAGRLAQATSRTGKDLVRPNNPVGIGIRVASIIPGVGGLMERAAKDAANLPAQVVPSLYVPAAAAVELAQGRPERGKKLLKDIKENDPVVNLVMGKPKKALELASEHPGFTAAELYGLRGSVGRGVTSIQHAAGKRPTVRAPAKLPGTDLEEARSYSRDAAARAGQRMRERSKVAGADARRAEASRLERENPARHADRIDELRAEANRMDPRRMTEKQVRQRAAARVAVNEQVRRENRTRVVAEARSAVAPRGGRKPTAAVTLAAQNITDMTARDLAAYKREIAAHYPDLPAAQQKVNRRLQAEIQKAIDTHGDTAELRAAVEAYGRVMRPRTQALVARGMLAEGQADKAPLVPYAMRRMGARHGVPDAELAQAKTALKVAEGQWHREKAAGSASRATTQALAQARARVREASRPQLLTAEGAPLRAPEIRAHMRERDVPEPTYVTQAPGRGGASAFYVSSNRPQSVPRATRTGAGTAQGTFEGHPDVLVEGAARAQGLIDAADGFTATIKEFAHKPSLGKLKTRTEAEVKARELAAETGVEFRPVRVNPFAGRQEQLRALLDTVEEDHLPDRSQPIREAVESAYRGEDGPGPWALIPRTAADEFAAHAQRMGAGPSAKVGQLVGQSFRRTVLATSPTWLTGNVVEASLRTALMRAGPGSYKLGRDVLARVDEISPKLGQELRARAVGGGHFKSADTLHVRRGAEQFQGTTLEPLARALHKFWQTPGPREAAKAWNAWTDLVFRQLNGRLESQFQTAMLGKALRQSPLFDNDLPALSAKAIDQAARGLTNTNEQAAFARAVERAYGKYNGFGADMRWTIAMYTPFVPWTINALKFAVDVLPRDHPTTLALIASMEMATEDWRKDHGLDLFMKEALPGFLQGSIPAGGDRHQRAPNRYTPFGAFGDPLDTIAKAVLPQYQGVLAAFRGEDWKGAKLRKPDGSEADMFDKAQAAAQSFAEATVPLVGIIKRVANKGPQALNPVSVTAPKPKPKRPRARAVTSVDRHIDRILSGGGGADKYIDQILGGGAP